MSRQMPTLKGLRAFEEVYILGNYTRAAEALNVQQPAISYQIKRLEQDLDVTLFARGNGGLEPTAHAHDLFDTVSRAFDDIRKVTDRIQRADAQKIWAIATYAGIAANWVSPRLRTLSQQLGVHTKLVTLVSERDLFNEEANCWIAFGHGDWPGFDARLLIREEVCPVASPSLAQRFLKEQSSANAPEVPFVEQDDPERRWLDWQSWLDNSSENWRLSDNRIIVNDHVMALNLALSGFGVALGWAGVVEDHLEAGNLVRLSSQIVTSSNGYWLLGRKGFFLTEEGQKIHEILAAGSDANGLV